MRLLSRWDWPPLWTPFQVLGKPLAAEPLSAVLYPPNWLLRLLPSPLGYNASVAVHHALAAAGMYALLRHRRVSALAAAFGGVLFGFGGLFVAFDNMSNALQSSTWAPWTVLAFDHWCERRSVVALIATALGLTLTLLGGMPEVCLFENVLFVAIAIDRRSAGVGPNLARAAGAVLIANAVALGLGAMQLLPTLEYIGQSSRADGLSIEGVIRLSLHPLGALAFLLPRHYVDPAGQFHETAALWEGDLASAPWAISLYLGPLLVLASAAGAELRGFRRWWWMAIGLAFLALACGAYTPGYRWLVAHVVVLRAARYPEKFLLVVHGLFVVAAALGLHGALRDPRRFRRIAWTAVGVAGVMMVGALALQLHASFARQLLVRDLAISALLLLAVAALAALGQRRPTAVGLALLALAAADLYRVNGRILPTVAWRDLRREPPAVAAMLRGEDPLRIYSDAVGRPAVDPFPDGFLQEQNLLLFEIANFYDMANLNAPASINLRDHEQLAELIEQVAPERVAPLLAAFNTAYVTSGKDLHRYPGLTVVRTPQSVVDAYLYRVDAVAPRAFVPRQIQSVASQDAAVEYLHGGGDLTARVAVESASLPPGLPDDMDGSVRLASYRPQEVELEASLRTPGLVVLTDTFYPGWEATVDDVPTPILRANHFARGVFAPAGEHRIVFRYRPWSYRAGMLISLGTAGILLTVVAASARKRTGG